MGPGVMNIQVRVLAANARRTIRGLRAEMAAVQAQSASTAAVSPVGKRSFADMTKAGNQMQWVGRQLQYNFTLPLLIAGAAATKFQLEQEAAMVHVAKVYGDATAAVNQFNGDLSAGGKPAQALAEDYKNIMGKELPTDINEARQALAAYNQEIEKQELAALEKNFDALSIRFATQKKEVIEVAGAWAAAGVSGAELARSVENTLIASNIGDMSAVKATEALISVQAQYNMEASTLKRTLAELNAIENATAIDMGGLIQSMAKSGSAAAASGTSAKYLAAMTAAISPAAGSASQAGNALKTILSRINSEMDPVNQGLAKLGINTKEASWQALSGAEKLQVMSKAFNKLDDSQQVQTASLIAGVYQYNRLIQLLKDMDREHGNYNKALDATKNKQQVFATMNKELNTILESNPKRLERMGVALQNSLADIIQPLIPYMVYLAQEVAGLARAFADLPPDIQKLALTLATLLIVLPLVLRYMGSLRTLWVVMRVGVGGLARALGIMTTATAVNTVVDGQATTVTEARRRGLIGLFVTMLKAPFMLFASIAEIAMARTSAAFMRMYSAAYVAVSWLGTRLIPLFAFFVARLVGGWWFLAKQQAMSVGFGEAAAAGASSAGAKARIAIAAAAARAIAAIGGASAGQMVVTESTTNTRRVTMQEAFRAWLIGNTRAMWAAHHSLEAGASASRLSLESGTSTRLLAIEGTYATRSVSIREALYGWLLNLQRGHIAARLGLEAGASSRMLALEAGASASRLAIGTGSETRATATTAAGTVARTTIVAAGTVAEVSATAAGATAKVGIIARMGAALTGLYLMIAGRLKTIWVTAIAFLMNPARIIAGLATVAAAIGSGLTAIIGVILSPWGIAIAAILGLIYAFRSQIAEVWNNIVDYFQSTGDLGRVFDWMVSGVMSAFNALPQGVQNAMVAVVTIVRDAALAVYEWFSYINPFAHHSPSLVENVTFGMAAVVKQFSTLGKIKSYTDGAYKELSKFGNATRNITTGAQNVEIKDDRKTLKKGGADKGALDSYDRLQGKLKVLRNEYSKMGSAIETLEKRDIVARRSMDDAIFSNSFAQKKLRLELMEMEEVGGTLDDVTQKLADLAGQQEILRGTQTDLRNAGAGSDILSFYDDQLKALDKQKGTLENSVDQMTGINNKLAQLQTAGEKLDLEKAMKFDMVDHRLEKMKEQYDLVGTTISDIESGIKAALQAQEALNAAAENRKSAREDAKKRSKTGKTGDSAAKAAKAAKAGAGATAGADYPDVTGDGLAGREDYKSQLAEINKETDKQIAQTAGLFAELNPFKSFGGWFKKTWDGSVKPKMEAAKNWTGNFLGEVFQGVEMPKFVGDTGDFLGDTFNPESIRAGLEKVTSVVTDFIALFWPDIKRYFTAGWKGLQNAFSSIGKELEGFGSLWAPLKDIIVSIAKASAPALAIIGGILLAVAKIVTSVIGHTIGPLLTSLGDIIAGVVKVIRGVLRTLMGLMKVIIGVLTLDPKMVVEGLGGIAKGIWEIFSGTFNAIFGLLRGAWAIIKGIVWGIVAGVAGFFKWLWDVLVGHSIVPDTVNGIIAVFKTLGTIAVWIYNNVILPIWRFFVKLKDLLVAAVTSIYDAVKGAFQTMFALGQWIWNNIINPVGAFFWRGIKVWIGIVKGVWGKIKAALNGLKSLATWIWNNGVKPVAGFFRRGVSNWIEIGKGAYGKIKDAMGGLKSLGKWVWDHSLGPVVDRFKDMFKKIGKWLEDNGNKIKSPMKGIMNFVIGAINKMTSGLNKVAKILPGISWHIDPIEKLARGGAIPNKRVGNGFVTKGARAIVGEGKANHPEFVVPTDPTHRNRALNLWKSLGQRLGAVDDRGTAAMDGLGIGKKSAGSVPAFGIGGLIPDAVEDAVGAAAGGVKKAAKGIKKLARNAASVAYKPFGYAVDKTIKNNIGWSYARKTMQAGHKEVRTWIKGADRFNNKVRKQVGGKWRKPLNSGYSIGGGLGSYKGHNGQDFPVPSGTPVHAVASGRVTSSRDIGNGAGGYRSYGRVVELSHADGIKSLYAHNSSRKVKTGQSVSAGDVIAHSGSTGNSSGPHLHLSMWQNGALKQPLDVLRSHGVKMAKGGIVKATSGGVGIVAGEAGQDEMVLPLPRDWKDGSLGGGKTFNFYGDLEFPNIENGDDAEDFISNLEAMAGE